MDELIEVESGVRLAVRRSGSGAPAVVCLSCAGGAHDEWAEVRARLDGRAQVVTYGRPTLGGSDPLPSDLAEPARTVGWAAGQLRTLLRNTGIEPPYVLVTSSVGSWIADRYAARWPDETAGMVLVDPTNLSAWPNVDRGDVEDGGVDGCLRWPRRAAYAELAASVPVSPRRCVVVSSSDGRWARDDKPGSREHFRPLTLAEVDQLWQGFQREWVRRLSAAHVVADTAGHFVHRDEPDLVAHVVDAVLDSVRADAPVRLDPERVAAVAGRVEAVR